MNIWYRVTDLEAAQDFYKRTFGFEQVYKDEEDRWARMVRSGLEIALAEGEFEGGGEGGEEDVIATRRSRDPRRDPPAGRLRPRRQPHPAFRRRLTR